MSKHQRSRPNALRELPSMTALLKAASERGDLKQASRRVLTDALRDALDAVRHRIASVSVDRDSPGATAGGTWIESILADAAARLAARRTPRLARVINATGIILHTGLGRSALGDAAVQRLTEAAGYCNVEVDLDSGERGRRGLYAEQLLRELTGAEAALIVNNNAAATMLVLHGLARGREVIVSRGQLIEIGGSFRLPEVMSAGGAILREVGTTNKTHLRDYETAIVERTALLMHVHTSNYRVVGFSECPAAAELAALAHARGLVFFDDLGSGALIDDDLWRLANEPTATASLRAGADVAAFSGDKLLGGPQCGILLGKSSIIDKLRQSPMARALRVDKLTLAALEATLELYLDPARARSEIPTLARLTETIESVEARARRLCDALHAALGARLGRDAFTAQRDDSFAGGGSLPAWPLPTAVVCWAPPNDRPVDAWSRRLRLGSPPVLARVQGDRVLFDLRTVREAEQAEIVTAVASALASGE
ncbi:MAG: L-seryl-tRNA(Sec) selenium transferase [Phycisphaerae bacterium]|nr:MAG: L-seryl-tRNA(Sec) selenium transferase [Planctomycetia bacterium]RIK70927.1 MAG: L-seryl-tRNA(Sec) selenium transferase [Planctomycetota bacterium]GJQ25069.1 MAG: L-seryl-tRNA(Sec) selenium transferase [Phycisphaerae bacterium]